MVSIQILKFKHESDFAFQKLYEAKLVPAGLCSCAFRGIFDKGDWTVCHISFCFLCPLPPVVVDIPRGNLFYVPICMNFFAIEDAREQSGAYVILW